MRLLNMNDLRDLRRNQLAQHTCVGKGAFASVFARTPDSPTVAKVTTDPYSYYLMADGLWHEMREEVEASFPRLLQDHGDVGESRGRTAYLVEVERLRPIQTTEHRRRVAAWCEEFQTFRMRRDTRWGKNWLDEASITFCAKKAKETSPYAGVFEALHYFLTTFGGALDLKRSNFMERADGTLIWNDVVFDAQGYRQQ